ncbi:CHAT domain-containing protein [Archangium violaceum]|uniref:CHAT domain-containing protein n=1 Tax=Archangium violaceum TaxID=83451 RepID=UPI00194DEFB6|nr:CHAT domain-containing protein [Archangium violaceum]QRN92925.1 CHAT domain-containing protein [Archangium violaceum]
MPRVERNPWLEITISRVGSETRISARSSREENPPSHALDPSFSPELLRGFATNLKRAVEEAGPIEPGLLRQAHAFHEAIFRGDLQRTLSRLHEAADDRKVLLRLVLQDSELKAFPWEALCEPRTNRHFLGNSPTLFPVRGVHSGEPWQARDVGRGVHLMVVAPSDLTVHEPLRLKLQESIEAGELTWLEPIAGVSASEDYLFERLRDERELHILHFIGHGRVQESTPQLRLVDHDGQEHWLDVELLAQEIKQLDRKDLRLIVLEACRGAEPGPLASAAELLVQHGIEAVIAYLWPVDANVARLCSSAFYKALTSAAKQQGDVAQSLNVARRMVLSKSPSGAAAFSPVLYLRGSNPVLFNFKRRKLSPAPAPTTAPAERSFMPPALQGVLGERFSLVLGDRWRNERPLLEQFRERLQQRLRRDAQENPPPGLPMSALTQRYALRFNKSALEVEFRDIFENIARHSPLVEALARWLVPGFHLTLLRLPVLELALARKQPGRTICTLQPSGPGGSRIRVMWRTAHQGDGWKSLHLPAPGLTPEDGQLQELYQAMNPRQSIVVFRPYCGYPLSHPLELEEPFLTEDDYLLGGRRLEDWLPPDLATPLLAALRNQPALLLGLSMLTWHHRMLLHRLFDGKKLPTRSLVLLEPGEKEQVLWERGDGLPSKQGVRALELGDAELVTQLEAHAPQEVP